MLYVDLNPVRARAAKRPEEWEGSSVFFRELKKDGWLIPLKELVECAGGEGYTDYKGLLYHRGAIPTKAGQAVLSEELLKQESERGFKRQGIYLKRLRYFTDGLALGGEDWVREQIGRLREAGQILRRENPTEQLDGVHFSLREQRSTFIPLI